MSPVAASDTVTTKEELEELREKLREQRRNNQSVAPPEEGRTDQPISWSEDRDDLIQFLEDLKTIMAFLIDNRVPEPSRPLFSQCFPLIETQINIAILELRQMTSVEDPIYIKLQDAELTGAPRKLKFREFWRRIAKSPVPAVLAMADRILDSFFKVLPVLEPVKEFKEVLEERLKNDGDAGIQSLNLTGPEQKWRQAE